MYKYVRWEIEAAIGMDIPIIAVNLNKENAKTPPILKSKAYVVSVPYEVKKIKYALDDFPDFYHTRKAKVPASLTYTWIIYLLNST